MDTATLYDDDIVTWAEQQAAALRELAAKPELSNAVDWENLIEEVECLGRSEWKGVASHLRNALAYVLKAVCDPGSLSRVAWAVETSNSLREAREDYRPSMRQNIDMEAIWTSAFRQAADALLPFKVTIPPRLPERCPFTLDEILDDRFTYDSGVRTLYGLLTSPTPDQRLRTPK
jgi:hypothetical protein